jgi:hypothetical protein
MITANNRYGAYLVNSKISPTFSIRFIIKVVGIGLQMDPVATRLCPDGWDPVLAQRYYFWQLRLALTSSFSHKRLWLEVTISGVHFQTLVAVHPYLVCTPKVTYCCPFNAHPLTTLNHKNFY